MLRLSLSAIATLAALAVSPLVRGSDFRLQIKVSNLSQKKTFELKGVSSGEFLSRDRGAGSPSCCERPRVPLSTWSIPLGRSERDQATLLNAAKSGPAVRRWRLGHRWFCSLLDLSKEWPR